MGSRPQLLALIFGILASATVTITTFLNQWSVSGSINSGLSGPISAWKGLFFECVQYKDESTQCKGQSSMFLTPGHILAMKGMMISSIVLTVLACIGTLRSNCTKPLEESQNTKKKVTICSGIAFAFASAFSFASGVWYVMLLHINFFRAENTNNGIQWDIGACLYLAYASSSLCGLASCACLCSISCKKHKNSSSRPSMSRNITTSSIDRQVSRCFHQNEEKAEKFSAKNLNKSAPTNVRSYEGRHSTFYQQRAQSKKNSATNFKNKSDTYRNYQYV